MPKTFELSDEQSRKLEEKAQELGIPAKKLLEAGIQNFPNQHDEEFTQTLKRVTEKIASYTNALFDSVVFFTFHLLLTTSVPYQCPIVVYPNTPTHDTPTQLFDDRPLTKDDPTKRLFFSV